MPRIVRLDSATRDVEREDYNRGIAARGALGSEQLCIAELVASCRGVIAFCAAHDDEFRIALYKRQAGKQEHRKAEEPHGWPDCNRSRSCNDAQRVESGENQNVQKRDAL